MAVEVLVKLAALIHVILIVTCENVKRETTTTAIVDRQYRINLAASWELQRSSSLN